MRHSGLNATGARGRNRGNSSGVHSAPPGRSGLVAADPGPRYACPGLLARRPSGAVQPLFNRARSRLKTFGGTRPVTSPPRLATSFNMRELRNE